MNAIKFIQQHGVEMAREVVGGAPELAEYYSTIDGEYYRIEINAVNLKQLKRLVESVDMINRCGGLVIAKKITFQKRLRNEKATHFIQHPENQKLIQLFGRNQRKPEAAIKFDLFEQAIADYEAIYSNEIKIEVSFGISLMPSERLACIDLTPRPVIDCEILDYPEDYTSPNCKKSDERVK